MDFLVEFLSKDYIALFIIIGFGIALGQVKVKGISLDSSAVIFVAILYGYILNSNGTQFELPAIIQQIGLLLFIFTIGMQAGPSFFEVFKTQGSKLISLAVIAVVSGAGITALVANVFDVEFDIAVGLFTGALTSTPGLAAAIEASNSPLASIGYGIAYPFGLLGVILFVKLSPHIFRVKIKEQEENYRETETSQTPEVFNRNFIISNSNIDGKTIEELEVRAMTKANISRIMRPDKNSVPVTPDAVLHKGDLIKAVGTEEALKKVEILLGKVTDIEIPTSGLYEINWYVVSRRDIVKKKIADLYLLNNFKANVTRVRRAGIDLPAKPTLKLRYGDRMLISTTKGNVSGLSSLLGNSVKEVETTSFLPVALGIVIGLLVGAIEIPLPGGGSFSLGITGGVLLAALILSRIGRTGKVLWNLPGTGNQILRQLGLLLFLTPVGLAAGTHIQPTIAEYGISLFGIGAIITVVPLFLVVIIGHWFMKINFLSILGALTGGMTSTPGLSAVDSMTDTAGPQVAYAAVYPFALVTIIICAQILAQL